ncbi:hypothetical protein [Psychrobacter sp. FDAARGOS_221]|uniref:hypothetical protein n=1 Tax=Psychrobacter sp. FDAARGOS_221 TaxID=1975705 RepID=UPI000BB55B4E|nr:hypothetical protein [Psychrobacter sp. FDAARGOS_221]PNK59693.1 hypothetical protein A6J60_001540 [Psychrobacter sp. FDAARGOS_221]
MIIIELNEGPETLEDIERIAHRLCEHDQLVSVMTEEEREDLKSILKPTLAADHNEQEKRAHWEHLIKDFQMEGPHGQQLRFYRDEDAQRLYFGDEEGFATIEKLSENENPITKSNSRF